MLSPIIVAGITLAAFVIVDGIDSFFSNIAILVYFLFTYANIRDSTSLATFYLIAILFVIVMSATKLYRIQSEGGLRTTLFAGLRNPMKLSGLLVGPALFGIMLALQGSTPNQIVGVPSLGIDSAAFGLSSIMVLGVVENRFFFTLFEIVRSDKVISLVTSLPFLGTMLGLISVALPLLLTSAMFSLFHITAYTLALSSLLFAGFTFTLWLVSYIVTGSDLGANIAHMLWNGIVTLRRLQVVSL